MPGRWTSTWRLGLVLLAAVLLAPRWAANRFPAVAIPLCGSCETIHLEEPHACEDHACPCLGTEAPVPSRQLQNAPGLAAVLPPSPVAVRALAREGRSPSATPGDAPWISPPSPHEAGVGLLLHA